MSQAIRHPGLRSRARSLAFGCDLDAVPSDPTQELDRARRIRPVHSLHLRESAAKCLARWSSDVRRTAAASNSIAPAPRHLLPAGACAPLATQCSDSAGSLLSFAMSTTELTFETSDDLKSSTATLEIENCGESDIWLQRAEIRQVSPSAGRSVFSLLSAPDFQELRISPGVTETLEIHYKPSYAFSREPGNLRLQVLGEGYHEFDVPLVPRTYCATATPSVETGLIQGAKRGSVFLQNCGTEPIRIESVSTIPNKQDDNPQANISLSSTLENEQLEPGDTVEVPYTISGGRLGQFNHRIVYNLSDAAKFAEERLSTAVSGRVVALGCIDLDLPPPDIEQGENVGESWTFEAKVGEPVEMVLTHPSDDPLVFEHTTPVYRFRAPRAAVASGGNLTASFRRSARTTSYPMYPARIEST